MHPLARSLSLCVAVAVCLAHSLAFSTTPPPPSALQLTPLPHSLLLLLTRSLAGCPCVRVRRLLSPLTHLREARVRFSDGEEMEMGDRTTASAGSIDGWTHPTDISSNHSGPSHPRALCTMQSPLLITIDWTLDSCRVNAPSLSPFGHLKLCHDCLSLEGQGHTTEFGRRIPYWK